MRSTTRVWLSRVFAVWFVSVGLLMPALVLPPVITPRVSVVSVPAQFSAPVKPKRPTRRKRRTVSAPAPRATVLRRPSPQAPANTTLCLAQVIYFEAAHEPANGLKAVAATVFHRTKSSQYPSSICKVVYQPYQYSWTAIAENRHRTPPAKYVEMAKTFLTTRETIEAEFPVTHFHHRSMVPSWARTLTYMFTIGQHKFYQM